MVGENSVVCEKKKILTYNETTGKSGSIKLKKYSPAKVVDVVGG